ncbi:MAG: alanine--tRNA ligase [Fusobacteriaceae bacterium]|nr:alanine--tRNA ligase [Fusobacteriaceae bacterium]
MLTGNEIRSKFIEFFEKHGHKHFESASLIPDDPTLLLTVAGMVPFKPYFLGQKEAPYPRVTTYQKSIRTNDLENVGRTARHHTFFEMLGNFSFGDYFKKEAILWSLEFVTEVLGIDRKRLWVSIFTTDDEAEDIWIRECDFPKERIVRFGEEDNWWSAGPTGSCGPCSEIYVDLGTAYGGTENSRLGDPDCDSRFIEIWNLVFTEYNRLEDGHLEPLPKKNIDTGAGLERIAAVVQEKPNNFETDLLFPILEEAARLTGSAYGRSERDNFSLKVITDHARAVTFLVNDGVLPANEGRGYILRRILRRAVRHGRLLGQRELFLYKIVDKVVEIMRDAYPDLPGNRDHVKKIIRIEEEKFSRTLDQGITLVELEIERLKAEKAVKMEGEMVFKLYDTYGFPYELTEEICREKGILVSREEFDRKMEEQREKARLAREIVFEQGQDAFLEAFYDKYGASRFTGYETLTDTGRLLHVKDAGDGAVQMIFDQTPFYAESGGQHCDAGKITGEGFEGTVLDVQKQKGIFMHKVAVEKGKPVAGAEYFLEVDEMTRLATMKNHSATHLLFKALKLILGDHVQQSGFYADKEKLRFDFNHYDALTERELEEVEILVNIKIAQGIPVHVGHMSLEEAKKEGAEALFEDKYGDVVRVVSAGDFSKELCGGTHVDNTARIGFFKIESESGVSAGIRRIEALTGLNAYHDAAIKEKILDRIEKTMKTNAMNVREKIDEMLDRIRAGEKEILNLKTKLFKYEIEDLEKEAGIRGGAKIFIGSFPEKSIEELRYAVDYLKDRHENAVIFLASKTDKALFAAGVTKGLTGVIKAGDLVKKAAQTAGGNGGGRPDFAQAGAKDPGMIPEALREVRRIIDDAFGRG